MAATIRREDVADEVGVEVDVDGETSCRVVGALSDEEGDEEAGDAADTQLLKRGTTGITRTTKLIINECRKIFPPSPNAPKSPIVVPPFLRVFRVVVEVILFVPQKRDKKEFDKVGVFVDGNIPTSRVRSVISK